jgi:hypothetical protein
MIIQSTLSSLHVVLSLKKSQQQLYIFTLIFVRPQAVGGTPISKRAELLFLIVLPTSNKQVT